MPNDGPINSQQVIMLRAVLNDYCTEAGIPADHPAKEHFSRRLMSLFQSGIVQPDDLKSKMNDGYEDWLGEIGATGHFTPPKLSDADQLVGNNILPGSDRRGRPATPKIG